MNPALKLKGAAFACLHRFTLVTPHFLAWDGARVRVLRRNHLAFVAKSSLLNFFCSESQLHFASKWCGSAC